MKHTIIASLLSLFALASATYALDFELVEDASTDTLMVVRGTGKVTMDDYKYIEALAAGVEEVRPGARIHVILESTGGSAAGGILLGETFHKLGISTGVAADTTCSSSCAVAWLGGTKNGAPHAYRHPRSRIGFHQPASPEPEIPDHMVHAFIEAEEAGDEEGMVMAALAAKLHQAESRPTESHTFTTAGHLASFWSHVNANVEILAVLLLTPNDSMTLLPYSVPSHNQ